MKSIVVALIMLMTLPLLAQPEGRGEERRERMEAIRIAFITKELKLTSSESEKFWPIYNAYSDKLHTLREGMRSKSDLENLSDAEAGQLINDFMAMEENKLNYQRQLYQDLIPIVGAKRVIVLRKTEEKFKRRLLERAGGKMKKKGKRGKHMKKEKKEKQEKEDKIKGL